MVRLLVLFCVIVGISSYEATFVDASVMKTDTESTKSLPSLVVIEADQDIFSGFNEKTFQELTHIEFEYMGVVTRVSKNKIKNVSFGNKMTTILLKDYTVIEIHLSKD